MPSDRYPGYISTNELTRYHATTDRRRYPPTGRDSDYWSTVRDGVATVTQSPPLHNLRRCVHQHLNSRSVARRTIPCGLNLEDHYHFRRRFPRMGCRIRNWTDRSQAVTTALSPYRYHCQRYLLGPALFKSKFKIRHPPFTQIIGENLATLSVNDVLCISHACPNISYLNNFNREVSSGYSESVITSIKLYFWHVYIRRRKLVTTE